MSRTKKLLFTILVASLSFAVGETICRVLFEEPLLKLPPAARINPYEGNPYISYARPYIYFHMPNARYWQQHPDYEVEYQINSLGFRWSDISLLPAGGSKRLIVIGDSIVEGHGSEIEETFSSLLQPSLRSLGWEVVSCGVQGASPIYYASNMDRYLNLNPDAVLIVLFDNDLFEDRARESTYFELPHMARPAILLEDGSGSLLTSSRFLTLLVMAYRTRFSLHDRNEIEQIIGRNRENTETNDEQESLNALSPYLVAPSLFDGKWNMSSEYLNFVVEKFRDEGITVMIANLSLLNLLRGGAFETHSMMLDEEVGAWARTMDVPRLSLVPAVRTYFDETQSRDIMFPSDGHPSPKGHRFLAANLRPWLIETLSGSIQD